MRLILSFLSPGLSWPASDRPGSVAARVVGRHIYRVYPGWYGGREAYIQGGVPRVVYQGVYPGICLPMYTLVYMPPCIPVIPVIPVIPGFTGYSRYSRVLQVIPVIPVIPGFIPGFKPVSRWFFTVLTGFLAENPSNR